MTTPTSILPAPAFALRLALGEMADAMILSGQRVLPRVAQSRGFAFRYETVDDALREICAGSGLKAQGSRYGGS